MVGEASTLQAALYSDIVVMAQSRRAAVRRDYAPANPTWRIHERRRSRSRNEAWIAARNATPKPFKWTAKADSILEKNARARQVQLAVDTN